MTTSPQGPSSSEASAQHVTMLAVDLEFQTTWSMGAPEDFERLLDAPVHVDPRTADRFAHVPGTALAGSLRQALGSDAEEWLGSEPPKLGERAVDRSPRDAASGGAKRRPRPGRLRVVGSQPTSTTPTSRGSTAIDPRRLAPTGRTLRTEQFVDPASVTVLLEHDGLPDERLWSLLSSWTPQLGRGRTVGRGFATVVRLRRSHADLRREEDLTWWLTARHEWPAVAGPDPKSQSFNPGEDEAQDQPENHGLSLGWEVREPTKVTVGPTSASREAPALVRVDGRPAVPGASWKGLFRHRVELILQVVNESMLETDRLDASAIAELAGALFGEGGSGPRPTSPKAGGRRGMLVFHDSVAETAEIHNQTHVPIDRFTGGAVATGPFKSQAIPRGATLKQRIGTVGGGKVPEAVANLLHHVAHDINDGLVGVGGGGGRGYGWLRLTTEQTTQPVDLRSLSREIGVE